MIKNAKREGLIEANRDDAMHGLTAAILLETNKNEVPDNSRRLIWAQAIAYVKCYVEAEQKLDNLK